MTAENSRNRGSDTYFVFIVLLTACVLLFFDTSIVTSVILVGLSLLLLKKSILYLPLIYITSWSSKFVVFEGFAGMYYYMMLFVIALIINSREYKLKGLTKSMQGICLFGGWMVLISTLSVSGEYYESLKVLLWIIFCVILDRYYFDDFELCNKAMVIVSVFATLFFVYKAVFSPEFITNVVELSWGDGIRYDRYSTVLSFLNPNSAAQIIVSLFVIQLVEATKKSNYWLLLIALLNFITILFLGSRTSFFAMLLITFFYVLVVLDLSVWKKILLLLLSVAAFFILYRLNLSGGERAGRLNFASIIEDEGSGRFRTWIFLFTNVIPNHFMMGIGLGRVNYTMLGCAYDADNLYVDVLCQTGLIGFVTFFWGYIALLMDLKKDGLDIKAEWCYVMMLTYLIIGFGESVFDGTRFWYVVAYSIMMNKEKYVKEKYV